MVHDESSLNYYVRIDDGIIISKLVPTSSVVSGYTKTTKEIYDSLTSFPYSCDIDDDGNLINIHEMPKEPEPPQPLTEIEKLKISQAEQFETLLMIIGGM